MKKFLLALVSICTLCLLSACGGNGSSPHTSVATHFSVTSPTNATVGVAFNFTVTALDASPAPAIAAIGRSVRRE
jgi:hypothetical protein